MKILFINNKIKGLKKEACCVPLVLWLDKIK